MPMIVAAVYPDDMPEVERVIGGALEGRDFDLFFRIVIFIFSIHIGLQCGIEWQHQQQQYQQHRRRVEFGDNLTILTTDFDAGTGLPLFCILGPRRHRHRLVP